MERLWLNALLLSVVLVVAGCVATPGETVDDRGTHTETPKPTLRPFPNQPDNFDSDSVKSFVIKCEKTLLWNEEVVSREGVTGLEFEAVSAVASSKPAGRWVVNVSVDATIEYVEPEPEDVGHEYQVSYIVDEEATERVNTTGIPPENVPYGTIKSC